MIDLKKCPVCGDRHGIPAWRWLRPVALILLGALLFMIAQAVGAKAAPSSGPAGGPVGTPVISTVDYTNRSGVLVAGDSITIRSYKQLPAQLPGVRIAINAHSGRNTALTIDSLQAQARLGMKLPPKLVMATGANDIFAPHAVGPQVQRLLAWVAATSPSTRVFWVDASVRRPAYALADTYNSATVNAAIRQYCTGNCSVISWAGFLARYGRPPYIDAGGVHPNTAGQIAWAKLIAGGIK